MFLRVNSTKMGGKGTEAGGADTSFQDFAPQRSREMHQLAGEREASGIVLQGERTTDMFRLRVMTQKQNQKGGNV